MIKKETELTIGTEPQKIAMNRKIYNEVLGIVEEFALEINGYNMNECRKHFDELAIIHDKFNLTEAKRKISNE